MCLYNDRNLPLVDLVERYHLMTPTGDHKSNHGAVAATVPLPVALEPIRHMLTSDVAASAASAVAASVAVAMLLTARGSCNCCLPLGLRLAMGLGLRLGLRIGNESGSGSRTFVGHVQQLQFTANLPEWGLVGIGRRGVLLAVERFANLIFVLALPLT